MDIPTFHRQSENEITEWLPKFVGINARFYIFDVTAKPGKVLAYTEALAARWTDAVVAIIIK